MTDIFSDNYTGSKDIISDCYSRGLKLFISCCEPSLYAKVCELMEPRYGGVESNTAQLSSHCGYRAVWRRQASFEALQLHISKVECGAELWLPCSESF